MLLDYRLYGVFVERMFSPIGRNAFFCCSRFGFSIDNIIRLAPAEIYNVSKRVVP